MAAMYLTITGIVPMDDISICFSPLCKNNKLQCQAGQVLFLLVKKNQQSPSDIYTA